MNAITVTATHGSIPPSHGASERKAPPIDCDQLVERCLGNLDFALTLLGEFAATSAARLAAFDAALAVHDHAAIAAEAHSFKGVVGILSNKTLMQICLNLEAATKDTDGHQTRHLIQQLHDEVRRMIDYIPVVRTLA